MAKRKGGPTTAAGKKRSLANLKPPWEKGVSANPNGRPKGSSLSTLLKMMCDAPAKSMPSVMAAAKEYGLVMTGTTTIGDVLNQIVVLGAMSGNDKKLELLFERVEGKVTQKIETEVTDKSPISELTRKMEEDA